ncbi:MAG: radical SAM protein [Thermoanaerobaculia bacterium]
MSPPLREPSSVYGPVHSWRWGASLGIDLLLSPSCCSFRCVYCQLGEIEDPTCERSLRVPTARVIRDLEASEWARADVITFSGSGEPTLAANLGEAISEVKRRTSKRVVVLTNAMHLGDPQVRAELALADEVCCKLDAIDDVRLARINRPVRETSVESIIEGIVSLRASWRGKLSLQIMLLPGTGSSPLAFAPAIAHIAPDCVQLNVPSRPVPLRHTLETRGTHNAFGAERAWRILDFDEVESARAELQFVTGIEILAPPLDDHAR